MKKSLVFRNSKSGSNATGNGVTFSITLGSSSAPLPKTETIERVKIRSAAANLISVIKRVLDPGVNAQPPGVNGQSMSVIGVTGAMELTRLRSNFLRD